MTMKLGSLFDGSGGFPLAGALCGIEPVWASEVEPYPIAVTRSRFPNMRHLGDVTKVHGGEIEPVDIITFGSPCQDLSVAGKRAGLRHEANGDEETTRSGLFMEAVRIIKEMREATNGMYPTFALWENVPGAFSSNGGEDFRTVCEELIKIVEPSAVMPPVPEKGWTYADSYVGDGWSLAYRVFDAQYWGVPQRRRRIHLVVDFRGERAREILFEREGLRGYFAPCGTPGQGTSSDDERGSGADDRDGEGFDGYNGDLTGEVSATLGVNCGMSTGRNGVIERKVVDNHILDDQGGQQINVRTDGKSPTLRAEMHGNVPCVLHKEQHLFENHSQDTRYKGPLDVSPMLPAQLGIGGNNTPFVVEQTPFCKSARPKFKGDAPTYIPCKVTNTLNTFDVGEARANELVVEKHPTYCLQGNGIDRADTAGCNGKGWKEDTCYTLNTIDRPAVAYAMQGFGDYKESDKASGLKARDYKDATRGVDCRNATEYPELNDTLQAKSGGGTSLNYNQIVRIRYIVRRIIPTECARLQGFADQWGHIEPKEAFTDEEYRFWLEVRNTHATINGKAVKDYTKPQMLTWYNKLWTDSAEYKMWGNGIALPPALYVMHGMAEALCAEIFPLTAEEIAEAMDKAYDIVADYPDDDSHAAPVRANLPECCTEE